MGAAFGTALLAPLPEPASAVSAFGDDPRAAHSCRACGFIWEACACDQISNSRFQLIKEIANEHRHAA